MNRNVQALARVMRKRESEVNAAWNQAKRHCSADGKKGNYVRAFSMTMEMVNFGQVSKRMLPENVGDTFYFMGVRSTLTGLGAGLTFNAEVGDKTLELPLVCLIFCTSQQTK